MKKKSLVKTTDTLDTLKERKVNYGAYETNAQLSQAMKEIVRKHQGWYNMTSPMRESVEMILAKISRLINGNPYHKDGWRDISGYAKLIELTLNDD